MAGIPLLSDLLSIPDQATVFTQEVQPQLVADGVKVTDWAVGASFRSLAQAVANMRQSVRTALLAVTAGMFSDYAFGFAQLINPITGLPIDVTGWAPWLAKEFYGTTQNLATSTRRTVTLTNSTGSTYGPLSPGALIIQFPSGNRYILDGTTSNPLATITIPANGSIQVSFRSEFASNSTAGIVYSSNVDPDGSTLTLVTSSFPGVTATVPVQTYSVVAQIGSGVGTVTPSGAGSPNHSITIRIDQTGTIAGGSLIYSYQLDSNGWVPGQTSATQGNIGGSGIGFTLADNGGNPAWVQGTLYYFTDPGTTITQLGADLETPQQLGTRCKGLVPSFAFVKDANGNWVPMSPTASAYATLALNANANVKVVLVQTDGTVNNKVAIVVAGQGGATLPAGVVANLQAFFNALSMITDLPVVSTSTPRTITPAGGIIKVKTAQLTTAQAEANRRLGAYIGGVDPNAGLGINGLVDYDYYVSLMRTIPGVTHIDAGGLTLNSGTTDITLPLTPGAYESPQLPNGFAAASAFTWQPV